MPAWSWGVAIVLTGTVNVVGFSWRRFGEIRAGGWLYESCMGRCGILCVSFQPAGGVYG